MNLFLIILILLLALATAFMYLRTSRTLKQMDEMIDSAINNTFSESNFSEEKLSKLETKMYRYLSAGRTSQKRIIQERNAIKSLVSDISHQTKTPIATILLYMELLQEKPDLDDSTRELLSQISSQTEKLNFLIQSLMKTSRLENGIVAIAPKKQSIKQLFENVDYTTEARKKGIRLMMEDIPDLTAEFDLKWTSETISNIIDNAIKYTPCGGTIRISAKEYELFVRIDIADTGIGMNEDETAKIFTRFYRSPAVSDEKGVGIGLYLAREILTMEGGYIKVSSKLGSGSVFSVFLSKNQILSKL